MTFAVKFNYLANKTDPMLLYVFNQIAHFAMQHLAKSNKSREAHSRNVIVFNFREVRVGNPHFLGKFIEGNFSLYHQAIEV